MWEICWRKKGYKIRVLDLISMEKSHCYNPFVYLHSDNDVQRLVTNVSTHMQVEIKIYFSFSFPIPTRMR